MRDRLITFAFITTAVLAPCSGAAASTGDRTSASASHDGNTASAGVEVARNEPGAPGRPAAPTSEAQPSTIRCEYTPDEPGQYDPIVPTAGQRVWLICRDTARAGWIASQDRFTYQGPDPALAAQQARAELDPPRPQIGTSPPAGAGVVARGSGSRARGSRSRPPPPSAR
jgi:hypothetical protein